MSSHSVRVTSAMRSPLNFNIRSLFAYWVNSEMFLVRQMWDQNAAAYEYCSAVLSLRSQQWLGLSKLQLIFLL